MPDSRTPSHAKWIAGLLIAAAILLVAGLLIIGERLPAAPQPVAWNKEACAHCRMHIGDPSFAAQLHFTDGRVESFDDPGCAFKALVAAPQADVHAVYFRHMTEDRWIARARVRFVSAEGTPMGYGLGAVEGGVPDSLSLDEAMAKVAGEPRAEVTFAR